MDRDSINLEVRADCGHKFEVSLGRLKTDRQAVCPDCGQVSTYDEQAIAAFDAQLAAITSPDTIKDIGKAVGDQLTRGLRGFKRRR